MTHGRTFQQIILVKRKADLKAIDFKSDKDDDDTVSFGDFDYFKLKGLSFKAIERWP